MRMTPKMSESPLARRNRSAPYESPLKVCETQQARGVASQDPFSIRSLELELFLDHIAGQLVAHVEAEVAAEHHAVHAHRLDQIGERARVVADRVVGEAAQIRARRTPRLLLRLRAHAL